MAERGRFVLSAPARRDLAEIWAWIAASSGGARAETVLARLRETCRVLAASPLAGRERPELRLGVRSFAVAPHVIFYAPGRDGILVLRVVHGARHLPRALQDLLPENGS
ncbi:MAG: type II toxin-antitoxin system RelE/ParE family toxin [Geminicoccaceae bacterium]